MDQERHKHTKLDWKWELELEQKIVDEDVKKATKLADSKRVSKYDNNM